jgi:iron-sulfur cluster insertion protein
MIDNIQVTEAAQRQICKLSKQHNKKFVRFAVTAGGCNGFNKVWSFEDELQNDDKVLQCDTGALLIDTTTLELITGAKIDYKNDLMGSFFTVDVPQSISSCGCGSSFSL